MATELSTATVGGLGGHVSRVVTDCVPTPRWHWRWSRRRPGLWVAPCRDEARRRGRLLVALVDGGHVALVLPHGGVAVLDLLTVGGLRSALRDAVLAVEDRGLERSHGGGRVIQE